MAATAPAAPPSRLSKKFMELVIPTTQKMVIAASRAVFPVGFPMVLVAIRKIAVKIPASDWAIKRGSGGRFLRSSRKPIKPRIAAGTSSDDAIQISPPVRFLKIKPPYEMARIPIIMATPPR